MSALALGLIAAACWGFHDICVRLLSQNTPITACIIVVLTTGLLFHLGLMAATDGFAPIASTALWLAIGAGAFLVMATFGLYYAFERGPVKLVSTLIATYPILSVGLAIAGGTTVSLGEWAAVLAIVVGVSLVAALSDPSQTDSPPMGRTAVYALISSVGFAGTFAMGQAAAAEAGDLPATLITRLIAVGLTLAIILCLRMPVWPGRRALPLLIAMGCADGIALFSVLSAGGLPDARYASVASSIFGLLTILLAWLFLKERLTLLQWLGCLLTFTAVGYLA